MPVTDLAFDPLPSTQGWQQKPSGWKLASGWAPTDAGTVGVGAETRGWGSEDDPAGAANQWVGVGDDLGSYTATTVDIGQGYTAGRRLNSSDRNDMLAYIGDTALRLGLGPDGARVAQAIAITEGGLGGAEGDKKIGGSYGAFQFYRGGGQLVNYARAMGMTQDQAAQQLMHDPLVGVEWALNGYLGNAIRSGQARGLAGAELATYAQRYGQVSESPERAGYNYNVAFGGGAGPISSDTPAHPGSAPGPSSPSIQSPPVTAPPERTPVQLPQFDWTPGVTVNGQQMPMYDWTPGGGNRQVTAAQLPYGSPQPSQEGWGISGGHGWSPQDEPAEQQMWQPTTTEQDWQNAGQHYEQQFGEPLDWSRYDEDPETYGYIESALGMSRAGDFGGGQDVGVGGQGDWWDPGNWWDDLRNSGAGQFLGNVGGALGGATFGSSPANVGGYASPDDYSRIQHDYGLGNPVDWAGNIVRDASQGQAGIYEPPIIGPIARVAGGVANAALGALDVPYQATMYGAGVLGGLGQLAVDQEDAGRMYQYHYGALGGDQQAPVARDLADVFDPAQARARAEAAGSPVLKFAASNLAFEGAGRLAGGVKAAGELNRIQSIREINAANGGGNAAGFRLMDVPYAQGIAEDVGRWFSQDTVRNAALAEIPAGFAAGFAAGGDPNDPGDVGSRVRTGAEFALPGLLAYAGTRAAPRLRGFADDYRVMNYKEFGDTPEAEAKFAETIRAHFPNHAPAEINRKVREAIDNMGLAVERVNAEPSPYESPYIGKALERLANVFVDRQGGAEAWFDYNRLASLALGDKNVKLPETAEQAMRLLAGTRGAVEMGVAHTMGQTFAELGLRHDSAGQDMLDDLAFHAHALDRAIFKNVEQAAQDPAFIGTPREYIQSTLMRQLQVAAEKGSFEDFVRAGETNITKDLSVPGFKATGESATNLAQVYENFYNAVRNVAQVKGADKPALWMKALFDEDARRFDLMRQLARDGTHAVSAAEIQRIYDSHGIYNAVAKVGDYADELATRGWSSTLLTNLDDPFDKAYSTTGLVRADRNTKARHDASLVTTAFQNRAVWALREMAQKDDGGFGQVMVPMLNKDGREALAAGTALDALGAEHWMDPTNVEKSGLLPKGWSMLTVLNEGTPELWRAPSGLAEAYHTMSPGTADKYIQMAGKYSGSNLFRLGVTTLSTPFIFANMARDYQDVLQNSKMPGTVFRNLGAAWYDVITHGFDEWLQANPNNKLIQALPEKVADSLKWINEKALGPEGRQFRPYFEAGGGGTMTEAVQGRRSLEQAVGLQPDWYGTPLVGGLGRLVKSPLDLIQAVSETAELATRQAVFRSGVGKGLGDDAAAALSRSVTVDFSRGGEFFKTFGALMPLVNARIQGQLTSKNAFEDDPQGYIHRMTVGAALPTMALYAYNRLLYNDLYDDIPQSEKDRNWIAIYGKLSDERDPEHKDRALYVKIPKNDVAALVANPTEHLMDTVFHVKHGQTDLSDPQRTERSAGQMWLAQFANMLPISMNASDVDQPGAWLHAAIGVNPLAGTIVQMDANKDYFLDRPIVPDDQLMLPKEFRRGPNGRVAPRLAQALTRLAEQMGLPEPFVQAPPVVAFAAKGLGGTLATQAMGSVDLIWDAFKKAGLPLPDFQPVTLEDLKLPKGMDPQAVDAYNAAIQQTDFRPWQQQLVSRFFGMGGNALSISAKVKQLSTPEQQTWHDTMGYFDATTRLRAEYQDKKNAVYDDPKLTASMILVDIHDLNMEYLGAKNDLQDKYPKAILDPNTRQQFVANLPGVPLNVEALRPSTLPDNVDAAGLSARYFSAEGIDMSQMNEQQQQQARDQWLTTTTKQYGMGRAVLRDYVAASMLNNKIVGIPVPDVYLNDLVDKYVDPPNRKDVNDTNELYLSRRLLIKNVATAWGANPQDLADRVQARMISLMDNGPRALSRDRALALSAKVRDESRFPPFVDPQGHPVGVPGEWPVWEAELQRSKDLYPGKPWMWPTPHTALNEAKANADTMRLNALYNDPDYYHYAGWFGQGKNMTPAEWNKFVTGESPRYRDNPGVAESARRDGIMRLYQTLPPSNPSRNMLRGEAAMWRRMLVPGWRSTMEADDVGNRIQGLDELYAQLAQ